MSEGSVTGWTQLVGTTASQALLAWGELLLVGVLLSMLTRLWYTRWLLGGLLFPTGRFAQPLMQILRTPGNITHEGGHAIGFLLCGYRVTGISFWFTDPQGRGYCQAGAPFAPWASPLLARLIASPAPLFAGALVLRGAAWLLEVPRTFTQPMAHSQVGQTVMQAVVAGEAGLMSELVPWSNLSWEALGMAGWNWISTPIGALQAIGFLFLIMSLSIDLAPSWEDVKSLSLPAFLVTSFLLVTTLCIRWIPALEPFWRTLDGTLAHGLRWIAEPLWWSLFLLLGMACILTPVRLILSGYR